MLTYHDRIHWSKLHDLPPYEATSSQHQLASLGGPWPMVSRGLPYVQTSFSSPPATPPRLLSTAYLLLFLLRGPGLTPGGLKNWVSGFVPGHPPPSLSLSPPSLSLISPPPSVVLYRLLLGEYAALDRSLSRGPCFDTEFL